jgi:hypothetical protein
MAATLANRDESVAAIAIAIEPAEVLYLRGTVEERRDAIHIAGAWMTKAHGTLFVPSPIPGSVDCTVWCALRRLTAIATESHDHPQGGAEFVHFRCFGADKRLRRQSDNSDNEETRAHGIRHGRPRFDGCRCLRGCPLESFS